MNTTSCSARREINRRLSVALGGLLLGASVAALCAPGSAHAEECLLDTDHDGKASAGDTDGGATSSDEKSSLACGENAKASSLRTVAIGQNSEAAYGDSTAVGWSAQATFAGSTALGSEAFALADFATAIGRSSSVIGILGTAVGFEAYAGDGNASAFGAGSAALGPSSLAVGAEAEAGDEYGVALGAYSLADDFDAIAIGASSRAFEQGSLAIGSLARVDSGATNAVALGYGSLATHANTVSIGQAGSERRIVNVAAGTGLTDAVNLGQLNSAIAAASVGTNPLAVVYDDASKGQVTFNSGGIATQLKNVAKGTDANDAVNFAQLTDAIAAVQMGGGSVDLTPLTNRVTTVEGDVATVKADVGQLVTAQQQTATTVGQHTTQIASLQSSMDAIKAQVASLGAPLLAVQGQLDKLFASTEANRVAIGRANEGVALALAMESPAVPSDAKFALSLGIGTWEGRSSIGGALALRLSDRAVFSAGGGAGMRSGKVGGRAGVQFAW